MSNRTVSPEEARRRFIGLRNLENLHVRQKTRIGLLEKQVRLLKEENALLRSHNANLETTIGDMRLQLEELRTIVFGKKRKKGDGHYHDDLPPAGKQNFPTTRTNASYQRKLPKEDEITEERNHPVTCCASCGGEFAKRKRFTYFEEDIPLPQKKIVIRHAIEKGWCETCNTWSAGVALPSAPVVLGDNLKRYVCYLCVVCRQSYSQIQNVLQQTYEFDISQGEIANILQKEGQRLRPDYERLKAKIRGEPSVHLDETGWNLFIGDGYRSYAWTMTGGESSDALFILGKTRGKGNADDLIADSKAVVVSDDYGAYRNLNNPHQLCCAHILRKLRDLAMSGELKGEMHAHCLEAYRVFADVYADIEAARTSRDPAALHPALLVRLKTFAVSHPADPAKLRRVKDQVSSRAANYLTCLNYPGVASDNNAAERSLRHLVLKRKISFGSLTEKTAETLAILSSVLLSWKQRGELRQYLMGA